MTRIVTRVPLFGRYFARRVRTPDLTPAAIAAIWDEASASAYARGCRDTEAKYRTLLPS